jgi:hypothetical protein
MTTEEMIKLVQSGHSQPVVDADSLLPKHFTGDQRRRLDAYIEQMAAMNKPPKTGEATWDVMQKNKSTFKWCDISREAFDALWKEHSK